MPTNLVFSKSNGADDDCFVSLDKDDPARIDLSDNSMEGKAHPVLAFVYSSIPTENHFFSKQNPLDMLSSVVATKGMEISAQGNMRSNSRLFSLLSQRSKREDDKVTFALAADSAKRPVVIIIDDFDAPCFKKQEGHGLKADPFYFLSHGLGWDVKSTMNWYQLSSTRGYQLTPEVLLNVLSEAFGSIDSVLSETGSAVYNKEVQDEKRKQVFEQTDNQSKRPRMG